MIKQSCKFDKNYNIVEYTETNINGETVYIEILTYYPNGQLKSVKNDIGEIIKYLEDGNVLHYILSEDGVLSNKYKWMNETNPCAEVYLEGPDMIPRQ